VLDTPKGVTPPSTQGGRSGFLSDVIVELGFAQPEQVEWAVRTARRPGTTVARVLIETGEITEDQLARAVAERYGLCHVDLEEFEIDPDVANLIGQEAARRNRAVPVGFVEEKLLVAIADPTDSPAIEEVAAATGREVRPAVASGPALDALIESLPLPAPLKPRAPEPAPPPEPVEEAPPPQPTPPAPVPLPSPPQPLDGSRLREELTALRRQLSGAEAKLGGQPRAQGGEVEQLRAELSTALDELASARARLREAKEVSAELEVVRERLAAAETELDRPRDNDWLRRRLGLIQAERDEALKRAHKAELELQELRVAREGSGRWAREDSELPDLH
jgi:Type II secretion system (T2SS), protein E, N-terminal domain